MIEHGGFLRVFSFTRPVIRASGHVFQQLKFYFKYANNCLPVYFQNVTFQTCLEI